LGFSGGGSELTASCQPLKLSSESVKAQLTGLELQLAELRATTNTSAILDDSLEAGDNQRKEVSWALGGEGGGERQGV
jgi:hypothetical protein